MTSQPGAVTPRSKVHVEIAVPLFQPHPPTGVRHPGDDDVCETRVGATRGELEGNVPTPPSGDVKPLVEHDRHSVDPHLLQGSGERHIVRSVSVSSRPVKGAVGEDRLRRFARPDASDEQHAIDDRRTHRTQRCFDYSPMEAG